jgi:hypothetical protein
MKKRSRKTSTDRGELELLGRDGSNGRVRYPLGSLKEVSNNGQRDAAWSTVKEMAIAPGAD